MFNKSSPKFKQNPWGDDHPERLTQRPKSSIDFGKQLKGLVNPNNVLDQLFGRKTTSEIQLPPPKAEDNKKLISKRETLVFSRQTREEDQTIQKETKVILKQLKEQIVLLEKSEKTLTSEIAKVKVEQLPKKSGIYYLRFFEWLIAVVRQLRIKVEEGRTWLATFTSRKKKRIGYWQMYKKHGTTFGLSHERTLATQTG